jgi:hypothetical protein
MQRKYPKNPVDFINKIEKFSGSKLNRKAELLIIVEEAEKNRNEKIFEDLIFTSQYLKGLMRTLQSSSENPAVKNMDHIKKDFTSKLQKASDLIRQILSSANEGVKDHFEKTFFGPAEVSLYNINELLADLEWTEKFLNEQRKKIK